MSKRIEVQCQCPHGRAPAEVVPGTVYCWSCTDPTPTRVGGYEVIDGQLCWVAVPEPGKPRAIHAFAVQVDGSQVRIERAVQESASLSLTLADGRTATLALARLVAAATDPDGPQEQIDVV